MEKVADVPARARWNWKGWLLTGTRFPGHVTFQVTPGGWEHKNYCDKGEHRSTKNICGAHLISLKRYPGHLPRSVLCGSVAVCKVMMSTSWYRTPCSASHFPHAMTLIVGPRGEKHGLFTTKAHIAPCKQQARGRFCFNDRKVVKRHRARCLGVNRHLARTTRTRSGSAIAIDSANGGEARCPSP